MSQTTQQQDIGGLFATVGSGNNKPAKKPVKNAELWQRLEAAIERHDVSWHWVKGHSDHPENDRADALARQGMAPYMPGK